MNVHLHNHSGHVLSVAGLRAAQTAADQACAARTYADVEVDTMRAGVLACCVSPSGVLTPGSAASKIREQNSAHTRRCGATISAHSIKETKLAVIRDRQKLIDASESDLRETFEAMSGAPAAAQASVGALHVMTSMAVLSNINAAGHLGVARGEAVPTLTHQELEARRKSRGVTAAGIGTHGSGGRNLRAEDESHFPLESNIMAAAKKTSAAKKATASADAATDTKAGRPKAPVTVSATGNGTTNVRPTSFRGQVLAAIAAKKKISTTDLDLMFEKPTLGEVRVLEKLGHVAIAA